MANLWFSQYIHYFCGAHHTAANYLKLPQVEENSLGLALPYFELVNPESRWRSHPIAINGGDREIICEIPGSKQAPWDASTRQWRLTKIGWLSKLPY